MKPIPRGISKGAWVTRSAKRRGEYSVPLRCSKCGRVIETGERYRRHITSGFGFRHVSECHTCATAKAPPCD